MELVDIVVEYPSGITISDRATFVADLNQVCVTERLASVVREFAVTEAPPSVTAKALGRSMKLELRVDGAFHVAEVLVDTTDAVQGLWARLIALVKSPTKEQRQQFGRFMHTMSAAALIGAIGLWHSTSNWTAANVLSEVNLVLAFVLTFYTGMVSMNGE